MGQRVTRTQLGATDVLRAGGVRPARADDRPEPDINELSRRQKKRRSAAQYRAAKGRRAGTPKAKTKPNRLAAEAKQPRKRSQPATPIARCLCGWEGAANRYELHKTWLGNLHREHGRVAN